MKSCFLLCVSWVSRVAWVLGGLRVFSGSVRWARRVQWFQLFLMFVFVSSDPPPLCSDGVKGWPTFPTRLKGWVQKVPTQHLAHAGCRLHGAVCPHLSHIVFVLYSTRRVQCSVEQACPGGPLGASDSAGSVGRSNFFNHVHVFVFWGGGAGI